MGRCGVWDKLIDNRKEDWLSVLNEVDSEPENWRELAQRGGFPEPAISFFFRYATPNLVRGICTNLP